MGTLPQERRFGRRRAALLLPPSLRDTPLRDGGFPPAAEWPFTRAHRMRSQLAGKRCVIGKLFPRGTDKTRTQAAYAGNKVTLR